MKATTLDTHAVIWLINGSDKLDKNLREEIEYFNGSFSISVISIMEIINLVQLGKISLGISIKELFIRLEALKIRITGIFETDLLELEKLPLLSFNGKVHSDMVDRMIITQAISYKNTLVSADRKFPAYRKYGLTLMEITS